MLVNHIYLNCLTYPEITTKIINCASALSQRGSLTTLHWVPSHTNIDGKHMITEYLHKQITPNQDTAKLSTWYNKTIVPGIHIINN